MADPSKNAREALIPTRPFASAWTIEDTRVLCDAKNKLPGMSDRGSKADALRKAEAAIRHKLCMALIGEIQHKASQGLISRMDHLEHFRDPFLDVWQIAASGQQVPAKLAGSIDQALDGGKLDFLVFFGMRETREIADAGESVHQLLTKLAGSLGQADSPDRLTLRDRLEDKRLFIHSQDGRTQAMAFRFLDRGQTADDINEGETLFGSGFVCRPITAGEIGNPKAINHFTIPAPSGEMLLGDWFRIPEFTDLCKQLEGDGGVEWDRVSEDLRMVKAYADHVGMASISVGNSSPDLQALDDGLLAVGPFYEDDFYQGEDGEESGPRAGEKLPEILGGFCTDLWRASIIDKRVLIDRLSLVMSVDDAAAKVNAMIDEGNVDVTQITPGTWHVYACGREEFFEEEKQALGITAAKDMYFVLSPKALDWPGVVERGGSVVNDDGVTVFGSGAIGPAMDQGGGKPPPKPR